MKEATKYTVVLPAVSGKRRKLPVERRVLTFKRTENPGQPNPGNLNYSDLIKFLHTSSPKVVWNY